MAGVEAVLGGQVGFGDAVLAAGQSVEDAAERQGVARHGLQVAEVGAAESQSEGGVRAEAVGGFQGDQSALGADEGGTRAQQLLQGVVQDVRAGEAFGEFVEGREVRDPAGEPVLEEGSGAHGAVGTVGAAATGGASGTAGAGATVCAGEGTVESIPATFGGWGAFMASGSRTGAYCSKASQTPM